MIHGASHSVLRSLRVVLKVSLQRFMAHLILFLRSLHIVLKVSLKSSGIM